MRTATAAMRGAPVIAPIAKMAVRCFHGGGDTACATPLLRAQQMIACAPAPDAELTKAACWPAGYFGPSHQLRPSQFGHEGPIACTVARTFRRRLHSGTGHSIRKVTDGEKRSSGEYQFPSSGGRLLEDALWSAGF